MKALGLKLTPGVVLPRVHYAYPCVGNVTDGDRMCLEVMLCRVKADEVHLILTNSKEQSRS